MTTSRVRRSAKGLIAVGVFLIPMAAVADPGDLDTGFSDDGYVVDDPSASAVGQQMALDASGRIVVAGSDRAGVGLGDILVVRYTAEGERDTSFSGDGVATLDIAGGYDEARDVVIDDQGRIVVTGEASNGSNSDFFVARYLANGNLDSTFSGDGWVTTDPSGSEDYGRAVVIDAEGRIVVAGRATGASDEDITVVRYLEDGSLDGAFSADLVDMGAVDGALALALDAEGRLVVTGFSEDYPAADTVVLRFEPDGDLDPTFSGDGRTALAIPGNDWGNDVVVDEAGRILVSGYATIGGQAQMVVHRLSASGALDGGFGGGGRVVVRGSGHTSGSGDEILLAGRGRIVVVGRLSTGTGADVAVARLTSDGSLESTFGNGGIATTDIGTFDFALGGVVVEFDDVIVAGYTSDTANQVLLARYSGSFPRADFTDDDQSVFESDIESLAMAGITRGCNPPDNTAFCPDDPVTRGQMAAFLVRALDYADGAGSDAFSDDDETVFESDIERLAEAGVTSGCNPPQNSSFCPDDPVTRGQMAAFLVRALGLTDAGSVSFDDTAGSVFEGDIARLAQAGVTRGCNPPANSSFCPDDVVTRGQMAAFLVRALALD